MNYNHNWSYVFGDRALLVVAPVANLSVKNRGEVIENARLDKRTFGVQVISVTTSLHLDGLPLATRDARWNRTSVLRSI